MRADPLALGVDDRRAPCATNASRAPGVAQRGVAARDLGEVGAGLEPERAAAPRDRVAGADRHSRREQRQHHSAPGSVAARSSGCTSRPSPPLETSTSRSTHSGNW